MRAYRPEVECAGLINHALRRRELLFHLPYYAHGPNLIITILYWHLYWMLRVEHAIHPPELFIQADNCWKENKNRWVLAFCAWMVMRGFFRQVHLSFLLQGHTHEDVDQMFAGISSKYLRSRIWTTNALLELVPSAYPTPDTRPVARMLPFVHDWKSYFDPVLVPMAGHSGPHVFVLAYNEDNVVTMRYKDYHSSLDQLRGGEGEGGMRILTGLPAGVPEILPPKLLPDTDIDQIPNLFDMPGVTEQTRAYWLEFMNVQIPTETPPEDYFDFEAMRLPQVHRRTFVVDLPPSGFEVERGPGYSGASSAVCYSLFPFFITIKTLRYRLPSIRYLSGAPERHLIAATAFPV